MKVLDTAGTCQRHANGFLWYRHLWICFFQVVHKTAAIDELQNDENRLLFNADAEKLDYVLMIEVCKKMKTVKSFRASPIACVLYLA